MCARKDIWQSQYYMIPRTYLTLVGLWPYSNIRNRYLRFALSFSFSFSIIVPQVWYLLAGSISVDDIFECVPSIFITITFSYKLFSLMLNNEKIKVCLETIEEDWLSLKSDVEKAILQQYTKYGQYVTKFYIVLMLMTGFFYLLKSVLMTLLEDENISNMTKESVSVMSKLPFHVEYGEKFDQYIYPIMIHCYLAVFAHVFITIAFDTLYYVLIQHACGMFTIIGYILENVGKNNDANFHLKLSKASDDDYNKALNCLRRHLQVIRFAELIESTYTNVLLLSVNLNVIAGSLAGIQVMMNLNNAKDIAAPLAIYIAQLTHLFLQFWQAQFLLDYSVVPYESISRSNWYYTSQRCRKIFLLIMLKASSPCKITAGKMITLSIESFGAVLKTSMSYFTMLHSFQ